MHIVGRFLRHTVLPFALTVGLALGARGVIAAPYYVPSGSMQPTLMIGDGIGALHFAYGFSTANLPFGNHLPHSAHRLFERLPERGDVVVFRAPAQPGTTWVKRVIGLPGDRVGLSGGRVWLNGQMLDWKDDGPAREQLGDGRMTAAERYTETLLGGRRHDLLKVVANGDYDDIPTFTVPAGHLFVMGDNRDNSADSRVSVADGGVGLLPVWNLEGRAVVVAGSSRHLARFIPAWL